MEAMEDGIYMTFQKQIESMKLSFMSLDMLQLQKVEIHYTHT